MANPLARVVMNNIAQQSGMVERKSSNVTQNANRNSNTNSNGSNLDRRESKLLTDLMNNKKGVTMGSSSSSSSSQNKSTYGRTTNVSNANANTMKTLDSLVSKANSSGSTNNTVEKKNDSCGIDKSRSDLRSLCSLDNISIGKTNVENNDRTNMKVLDLSQLASGNTTTNKREAKVSYNKQTSGMTTLGDLANEKTKNKQQEDQKNDKTNTITSGNSYVKSNVINNLEAYIPKVTLESIGKKGSLF